MQVDNYCQTSYIIFRKLGRNKNSVIHVPGPVKPWLFCLESFYSKTFNAVKKYFVFWNWKIIPSPTIDFISLSRTRHTISRTLSALCCCLFYFIVVVFSEVLTAHCKSQCSGKSFWNQAKPDAYSKQAQMLFWLRTGVLAGRCWRHLAWLLAS